MKHYLHCILAPFALSLAAAPPAAAAGDLVVAAQETAAIVTPRPARLKLVNIPALEFGLRAAFRCRKGDPVSLTLSIADTFITLQQDQLAAQRAAELALAVPPGQLALAASSRFCIAGDPETSDELLVPGLATAHASLRCAGDDGESVHFASAPLQVRLICERGAMEQDQAPSGVPADK